MGGCVSVLYFPWSQCGADFVKVQQKPPVGKFSFLDALLTLFRFFHEKNYISNNPILRFNDSNASDLVFENCNFARRKLASFAQCLNFQFSRPIPQSSRNNAVRRSTVMPTESSISTQARVIILIHCLIISLCTRPYCPQRGTSGCLDYAINEYQSISGVNY